jgi:DNA-binding transcriptional regulator YbjK
VLEISKHDLAAYWSTAQYMKRPENYARIRPGKCPREKAEEIARLYLKAVEDQNKKSLSQKQKDQVKREVEQRIQELEAEAQLRLQMHAS